ncbi:uncharacterized protein LOC132901755 isoform X1 [Amyelois transitella]|uniref:uncharacterized protein LOC106129457 isoform X1 n=1 Tax=Amyelois transitella TaxID=680683 RepID=UPI00298FC247|nr:uncharacterized protein LOC106129457 isoform X1 [Amyelois transitella]XP_060809687.1 uncharacterized protein LOC132901755 isoform X1 [Amyelois transitella]
MEDDTQILFTEYDGDQQQTLQTTASHSAQTSTTKPKDGASHGKLECDYGQCTDIDLRNFEQEYLKFIKKNSDEENHEPPIDDRCEITGVELVVPEDPSRNFFSDTDDFLNQLENHEEQRIFIDGCGCAMSCQEKFPREAVLQSRLESQEMNTKCDLGHNHLNLFTMGALNALTRQGSNTLKTNKNKTKVRKAAHTTFFFQGIAVCKNFFQFVYALGEKRYKNIKSKVLKGNLATVSSPHNFTLIRTNNAQQTIDAVLFKKSFSEQNSLVLPGRVPSFHNPDLHILPSSMNKRYVYDKYQEASKLSERDAVSLRTWYRLWQTYAPNIVIQKPRTDLCTKCQENITALGKMQGLDENEKRGLIEKSSQHLDLVQTERAYYKQLIDTSADVFGNRKLGQNQPCSSPGKMHYSFDFAQQVHLPHSSQQVGPLYFLAGYKIGLFGIAAEPLKQFVLYIIPEACNTGKGSNTVISLLDHFFNNFGLGETDVICHADNCSGQNKNNFMMQYALWRTLTGKHKSFQLSFLPVGHTKFAPDLYFGLFKKKFRLSNSNTARDVLECAVSACHNSDTVTAVLVGNETGDIMNVHSYNWADFFKKKSPQSVTQLLSYNHFKASIDDPGVLHCTKKFDDQDVKNVAVFNSTCDFTQNASPTVIPPTRLSFERQQYLFQKIRVYVSPEAQNVLCPEPIKIVAISAIEDPLLDVEMPLIDTESATPSTSALTVVESQKRKTPKCGYCGEMGHRNQKRSNVYFCKKRELDERLESS